MFVYIKNLPWKYEFLVKKIKLSKKKSKHFPIKKMFFEEYKLLEFNKTIFLK